MENYTLGFKVCVELVCSIILPESLQSLCKVYLRRTTVVWHGCIPHPSSEGLILPVLEPTVFILVKPHRTVKRGTTPAEVNPSRIQ